MRSATVLVSLSSRRRSSPSSTAGAAAGGSALRCAGAKVPDVDVGIRMLATVDVAHDRAARLAAELLDAELQMRFNARRAARLALLAVLRHHAAREARGSLPGIHRFVARAHSGELL